MGQALMQLMTILTLSWPEGTIRRYGHMKRHQTTIWMFSMQQTQIIKGIKLKEWMTIVSAGGETDRVRCPRETRRGLWMWPGRALFPPW